MTAITNYFRGLAEAWDRFWFSAVDPAPLGLIRLLAGAMIFYTHLVWSLDLAGFFGPDGWLPLDMMDKAQRMPSMTLGEEGPPRFHVTIFEYLPSMWMVWAVHIFALAAMFCLMIGLFSRTTAVISFVMAVMYVARVSPGAYFGLDKVNVMLAMYLMLGPCGARYSVDRLLAIRRGDSADPPASISANLALRLMQLHLCIVYLFGGLGKLVGDRWWDGTAAWYAIASVEYRSIDMTWLAGHQWLLDIFTHGTVFLELFYCCLIWNRWARPWVLLGAIGMHLFIAAAMGMITFGVAMIIANLAFFSATTVRRWCDPVAERIALAAAGKSE